MAPLTNVKFTVWLHRWRFEKLYLVILNRNCFELQIFFCALIPRKQKSEMTL